MSTQLIVQIVLGLAGIGAVLLVLRWAWNSRKAEGGTAEQVRSLLGAIVGSDRRSKRARKQEGQSHAAWKKAGAARRKRRKP